MRRTTLFFLLAAVFGASAFLAAQEAPKVWDPKKEPAPNLKDWLKAGNRVAIDLPFEGTCAIPLLEVPAKDEGAMRVVRPGAKSNMPVAEPRVCESSTEAPVLRFVPKEQDEEPKPPTPR